MYQLLILFTDPKTYFTDKYKLLAICGDLCEVTFLDAIQGAKLAGELGVLQKLSETTLRVPWLLLSSNISIGVNQN